jgi:Leucine-rich repeat (LRR) protein
LGELGLLRVLSLNENKIDHLAGDFFVHMANLEVLKLSDNKLREVPRELGTLSNLQVRVDVNPGSA